MKKQKLIDSPDLFDLLSEEISFLILDKLDQDPLDRKSFSLTCKSLYAIESKHRTAVKPLRVEHLPRVLSRFPNVQRLDLTLCPRVNNQYLRLIAGACGSTLRSLYFSRSGFFSAAGFLNLAANCWNLKEIDLSNAAELRDSSLAAIAEAKNLERLWLSRCKRISDMGVGCVAVGCRKLKLISLKWCLGVGDLGVALIACKCKEIRSLDLSYLHITYKSLSAILELEDLEDLTLEGCFGIDDDTLLSLTHGCKSLKKLDISRCQNIGHLGLSSLVSGSRSIQQLTLAHFSSSVSSALSEGLKKLPMLQSINLDGCCFSCDGLKAIGSSCVSLRELSLSKCMGVTDEGLSFIAEKHKDLKKLDITCCRKITDVSINRVANSCPGLVSLRMESCSMVSREAFVSIGKKCHSLEELDLTDNEIDDEGLRSILRCSNLLSLKLGICLNISDRGLAQIGMQCPQLRELDLYRSAGITDLSISMIGQGCPNLEMINIAYCRGITDASLVSLSKCLQLTTLECRGCSLITSAGLAAIAVGCRKLKHLDIKKCQDIDDSGMIALARSAQSLLQINLSHTCVTDVGLLSLASLSRLQALTLLHLRGITPSGLAATLLACGGLIKAKLHASFRSWLPQPLFEHLETRGCSLLWKDTTTFPQEELDPKCWKLQLDEISH